MIEQNVNPIKILVKKILDTDSNLIMNEACKSIRNLAVTKGVRRQLHENRDKDTLKPIMEIVQMKFVDSDPIS